MIPKKYKPNKWRLILDLSSPEASLAYISVNVVVAVIGKVGKGALLGKMNIQQVYRNVPVITADRKY